MFTLKSIGTWAVVGVAVVLLVVFGLWRRAASLLAETKVKLAVEKAAREAAARSAQRERDVKAKSEEADKARDEAIAEADNDQAARDATTAAEVVRLEEAKRSGKFASEFNRRREERK